MELYPELAPNTVSNFIKLINDGFYNGLTYHRVIPDVLIKVVLKKEVVQVQKTLQLMENSQQMDLQKNTLKHLPGTVSMARADYSGLDASLTDEGI